MRPSPRRTGSTTRKLKRTGGPNQTRARRSAALPGFGVSSARAALGPAPLPPAGAGPGTKPGSGPLPPAPPHGHSEAQNLGPRGPAERLPAPGPPLRHPSTHQQRRTSGESAARSEKRDRKRQRGAATPGRLCRGPPTSVPRPLPAVNKAARPGRTARPRAPFPSERSLPPSPRSRRHLTAPAAAPAASPSTTASRAPRCSAKRRRRETGAAKHTACFIPPPLPSGNSTARLGLPPPRRPLARGAPPGTAAHWGASAALTRHRPSAPSPLAPCGRARPRGPAPRRASRPIKTPRTAASCGGDRLKRWPVPPREERSLPPTAWLLKDPRPPRVAAAASNPHVFTLSSEVLPSPSWLLACFTT